MGSGRCGAAAPEYGTGQARSAPIRRCRPGESTSEPAALATPADAA